jgi:hypothetical protein
MLPRSPSTQKRVCLAMLLLAASLIIEGQVFGASREQLIPILGVRIRSARSPMYGSRSTNDRTRLV